MDKIVLVSSYLSSLQPSLQQFIFTNIFDKHLSIYHSVISCVVLLRWNMKFGSFQPSSYDYTTQTNHLSSRIYPEAMISQNIPPHFHSSTCEVLKHICDICSHPCFRRVAIECMLCPQILQ